MEISREDFITIINYVFHGYMSDFKNNNPAITEFIVNMCDRVVNDKDKIIVIGIKD